MALEEPTKAFVADDRPLFRDGEDDRLPDKSRLRLLPP
jgi:hypothetical protein